MPSEHVAVAVVGAGPAGLMAAVLLARAGVAVQVLEQRPGTSVHPRARGLNVRTMEILRTLGLEQPVREAGAALALSRYMLFVETLAGREIRRVADDELVATGDALDQWTPCDWCQCAQDELEPILLAAARSYGADVRFNSQVVAIDQDDDGVDLRVRASGLEHTLRAQYVVAADGAGSMLREALHVGQHDGGIFGNYVNIYFRADLSELVRDRWFGICFVENQTAPGLFLAVNNADRWLFNAEYDPATGTTPADFTPDRCRELVRAAVGIPDLDVELLSVLPWQASARIAETFRVGRVLLAGDAAHVMPPAGGFGLNTGVQDAHNLAWKLALVLRGHASPALLDSYASEREAAAMLIVGEAIREVEAPTPDTPRSQAGPPDAGSPGDDDGGPPHGPPGGEADPTAMLAPVLAYRYESPAIIADGSQPPTEALDLVGRPGTRAPHIWLERSGQRISAIDLFDGPFVLLTGPAGTAWCAAAHQLAGQTNTDIRAYRVATNGDLVDVDAAWQKAYGVASAGAVLVRPDGFVAWRTQMLPTDPLQQLRQVLKRTLCAE